MPTKKLTQQTKGSKVMAKSATSSLWKKLAALSERLKASGVRLPSDLAQYHDRYAVGKPKA